MRTRTLTTGMPHYLEPGCQMMVNGRRGWIVVEVKSATVLTIRWSLWLWLLGLLHLFVFWVELQAWRVRARLQRRESGLVADLSSRTQEGYGWRT